MIFYFGAYTIASKESGMNGFDVYDLDKAARYFRVDKSLITEIFYTCGCFGIFFKQPAWNDKTKIEEVDLNVKMTKQEALRDFDKSK